MVYLDGIYLPVRMARRVVKVPVLVALGVRKDGQKILVALQLVSGEATAGWEGLIAVADGSRYRPGRPAVSYCFCQAPIVTFATPDHRGDFFAAQTRYDRFQSQQLNLQRGRAGLALLP